MTSTPPPTTPTDPSADAAAPAPAPWAPLPEFSVRPSEEMLQAVAERLRTRNFEAVVVDSGADARRIVLERLPDGAEVHSGKSRTLEEIGLFDELMASERYDMVRRRTMRMDRRTQMREIAKAGATPEYMLGSVQAVTEAGQLVVASASGSQIGPYSGGAAHLILVVGSQKIVPDLDTALRRIREHVQPYEDERLRAQLGVGTKLARVLIMEQDFVPGRTTVILVREPVGI
ncbi:MAG TPA: LUD domain-containing protein [Candidatus Dormibacteraeota bacterium]|nr:LUD domain-containing protein [Candidatus Dormibacteraeota bacterium]